MGIKRARASVDVYGTLTGDPICIDHGYGQYDIVEKSYKRAVFDFGATGKPFLDVKEGIGLSMRPVLVPKDTRKNDYTLTPASSWDEWRPQSGGYRVYRIRHFSAALGEQFSAPSKHQLPENPDFAFELLPSDTPAGWDPAIHGEPFYRLVFGGGTWGIYLGKNGGNFLQQNTGSGWESVAELPSVPKGSGLADQDATWVFIRVVRGQLQISMDFGKSYDPYPESPNVNTAAVFIPAGYIGLEGAGGIVSLGVHQLDYTGGNFYSAPRDALEQRALAIPTITGRYQAPYGSSVIFANASTNGGRNVQYRVTMAPGSRGGYPWPIKSSPSLQATTFRYPVVRNVTVPAITNPWNQWLKGIDIDKPPNLDGGTATIYLEKDAWSALPGIGIWTKIRINLGYYMDDGTTEWYVAFTGYCRDPVLAWSQKFSRQMVTITADNATVRFKRTRWTPHDVVPLGGLVPNAAADYILKTEGLMDEAGIDTSYRNWTTFNNTAIRPLEEGLGESPGHLIRVDATKWSTFMSIFEPYGVEMGADDYGVYITLPEGYIDPTVTKVLRADIASGSPAYAGDLRELIDSQGGITSRLDSSDRCTAVMVIGELPDGSQGIAWSRDSAAETNAAAVNACPWREVVQEIRDGVHSQWELMGRNSALSFQNYRLKWFADAESPIDPRAGRKQRVAVYGCEGIEIPDGKQYSIAAIHHSYRADMPWNELHTTYGLERTAVDV
jgi:hypothetical protein